MKVNIDKCHFVSVADISLKMTMENFSIQNSDSQKPLIVTLDRNLSFDEYLSNLRKKANVNKLSPNKIL